MQSIFRFRPIGKCSKPPGSFGRHSVRSRRNPRAADGFGLLSASAIKPGAQPIAQQIPLDPSARADSRQDDGTHEVAPDLAYRRLAIVNVVFVGRPGAGDR